MFVDQYQRDYSLADPSNIELEPDYKQVPFVPFTDRLFFAVPSHLVANYRKNESSVNPETLRFPQEADRLVLRPADQPNSPGISVVVARRIEQRDASGLIEIDGQISTGRVSDVCGAQTKFEAELQK